MLLDDSYWNPGRRIFDSAGKQALSSHFESLVQERKLICDEYSKAVSEAGSRLISEGRQDVEWIPTPGPHEMPSPEISKVRDWPLYYTGDKEKMRGVVVNPEEYLTGLCKTHPQSERERFLL
jgi:hypothetical protein